MKNHEFGGGANPLLTQEIQRLSESISDPEVAVICRELRSQTDEISQQIAALNPVVDPTQPDSLSIPTQAATDELLIDFVGDDEFNEATRASKLFSSLQAKFPELPSKTLLRDGIAHLVFIGENNRKHTRRRGQHIPKVKTLINYWEEAPPSLNPAQIIEIRAKLIHPFSQLFKANRGINSDSPLEKNLAEIDEILKLTDNLDPSLNFSTAKFLIFNSIIKVIKKPEIGEALARVGKDSKASEDINASPFSAYYHAAVECLKELESDKPDGIDEYLNMIVENHVKGRLFKIQSRQFKEDFKELKDLCSTYRQLTVAEQTVELFTNDRQKILDIRALKVKNAQSQHIVRAFDVFKDAHNSIIRRHNDRADLSNSDSATYSDIEADSIKADEIITLLANDFLSHLKQLGVKNNAELRDKFKIFSSLSIQEQLVELETLRKSELREAEIQLKLAEFQKVDGYYYLTNKKLRERSSNLIYLAKELADVLIDHDPVPINTIRSLIGLMQGVFWERTGQKASLPSMIDQYAADAVRVRAASSDLDKMGYKQESRLLKLLNLLDEIIDSGIFDDPEKHPELEPLREFVNIYIASKTIDQKAPRQLANTLSEDQYEAGADATPDDMPAIPIEVFRQANHEDILVFPPSAKEEDVVRDYGDGIDEGDKADIEWDRIKHIVRLRDQFIKQGLEVTFIRTKHASWQVLPFFVLEVKLPNDEHGVAVVESPVYGNATYIFRESGDRLPWRDVVQMGRREARDLGAKQAVHVDSTKLDKHAEKVWNRVISELTVAT